MQKLVGIAAVAAIGLVVPFVPVSADTLTPAKPATGPPVRIAWSPCPGEDLVLGGALQGLECGSLAVPLDHSLPNGRKLTLALTRAKHTSPPEQYQGTVLLNRGQWPGSIGRDLPTRFANGATGLPTAVGSTYDWIGFDPRGVGASEPMVACDSSYLYRGKARPDYVPRSAAEEQAWLSEARKYADSCADKYGDTLKFLNTKDTARDMDLIRAALGERKINYFGYSYGTYLGSVYASMFPQRVRRMVLDSVVRPSGVGYKNSLEQNVAFDKRAKVFFAWIAKYDALYHLGTTQAEVEANYYKGMEMVRQAPIEGKIGPAEYSDIFLVNAYRTYVWTYHATVLADWVLRSDPAGLKANYLEQGGYAALNTYSMYTAIQCNDAPWPRNWKRWREDHSRQYNQGIRFFTWNNAWSNAPCLFWPVRNGKPQKVGHPGVNMLLVQPENDGATPVGGAYEVHERFPSSRFVLELGGNFHGSSLTGNANACMNGYVIDYLRDGSRPASRPGADATCGPSAASNPTPPVPATSGTVPARLQ